MVGGLGLELYNNTIQHHTTSRQCLNRDGMYLFNAEFYSDKGYDVLTLRYKYYVNYACHLSHLDICLRQMERIQRRRYANEGC